MDENTKKVINNIGLAMTQQGQAKIRAAMKLDEQKARVRVILMDKPELAEGIIDKTLEHHGAYFLDMIADKLASGEDPIRIYSNLKPYRDEQQP